MTISAQDALDGIRRDSAAFADAAEGNLTARVEHCPDWSVADLVRHLTEVHWFWATIAEGSLPEPPDDATRPARGSDDELLPAFRDGAARLVSVLGAADQAAPAWTWADQKDVAFITRHQVQEAAVHAWDAVNAAGGAHVIDAAAAADAVDEFLTFSLATEDDARQEALPPLDGRLVLRATDTDTDWTVRDGAVPGSVRVEPGARDGDPVLAAPASDLLLWLYGRVDLDLGDVPADLVVRFREDSFTD